jgi:hypothetical protein
MTFLEQEQLSQEINSTISFLFRLKSGKKTNGFPNVIPGLFTKEKNIDSNFIKLLSTSPADEQELLSHPSQ